MAAKRNKTYRKLMEQYCMSFGFREPYQVLVDAELVRDSCRFKMDLPARLQRTVQGKIKPLITQCEIRKLYAQKNEPSGHEAIELAKTFERRRCGHHPEEYPEPLSTEECLLSVVDPKSTGQNKHRYVVASQSQDVRRKLRGVRGVPLVYIRRSVMILEPMADETMQTRLREERIKFRSEIKGALGKRKREAGEDEDGEKEAANGKQPGSASAEKKKQGKGKGMKGPNPLSVKKAKTKTQETNAAKSDPEKQPADLDAPAKRKRRRKAKKTVEDIDAQQPDLSPGDGGGDGYGED